MNTQWHANKFCVIHTCMAVMFGIIAGLNLALQNMTVSGILVALTVVFGIFAATSGFYPDASKVRKRNLWRIGFFSISHVFVYMFIEGGKSIDTLCKMNHPVKIIETVTKTYSSIVGTAEAGLSILKIENPGFESILWVYLILFVGFCIPCYKVLRSWGWPCVISSGLTIVAVSCTLKYWATFGMPWHWVAVAVVVICGMLALYFGKKTFHMPAIA